MRISCGQEPRWYRVNVLDVGREHLGRCIAAAAAVGTLTAVHDAYYSGSPCRTLMIDTVAGEIATVTYSGRVQDPRTCRGPARCCSIRSTRAAGSTSVCIRSCHPHARAGRLPPASARTFERDCRD